MTLEWPQKDPSDTLDFSIDFAAPLAADDDTLVSASWSIPSPLVEGDSGYTGSVTYVWIGGGVAAADYICTVTVETAGGRTYQRSATLKVREM